MDDDLALVTLKELREWHIRARELAASLKALKAERAILERKIAAARVILEPMPGSQTVADEAPDV